MFNQMLLERYRMLFDANQSQRVASYYSVIGQQTTINNFAMRLLFTRWSLSLSWSAVIGRNDDTQMAHFLDALCVVK